MGYPRLSRWSPDGPTLCPRPPPVAAQGRPDEEVRNAQAWLELLAVVVAAGRWCAALGVEGGYNSPSDGDGEAEGAALCPGPAYQRADDHPH